MSMAATEPETAIVITVPDTDNLQVLVRLPGHLAEEDIAVDFRPAPGASWTPSVLFDDGKVEVRHQ